MGLTKKIDRTFNGDLVNCTQVKAKTKDDNK